MASRGALRTFLAGVGVAAGLAAGALVTTCGGRGAEGEAPRTVVLVTVDTLRRDRSLDGRLMPRLSGLAARGTRFDDARAPAPLTLPSHVTMLSGLPPWRHGARTNSASRVPEAAARPWPLLAERFAAEGRRCGAFVSAGPLSTRYGLAQGFETYDDGDLDDLTGLLYAERAGAATVERALAWIRGLAPSDRAFLWVHLFEPHEPHPPAATPADAYDADAAAADRALGLLLDGLDGAGRGDAVVCLASDHGEALGDLGESSHGFLLPESVLRVPLLFAGPGVPRARTRRDPADLADVLPTLLALGHARRVDLPDDVGCGRDLLAAEVPAGRARVAEGLHAWHQFRWAQLSCAVVSGRRLEDRGAGRERRWALAADGSLQELPASAASDPADLAAVQALRAYRKGEQRSSAGGDAPGGYGAGGAVGPLLEPAENARRPDPYEVVSDAYRIGQVAEVLSSDALAADPARVRAAQEALSRVAARDPRNPAVAFWKGQGFRRLLQWDPAALSFREAMDLGRVDVETILLLSDSVALSGRGGNALEALRAGAKRVPPATRLYVLEARLLKDLGRPSEEVSAACRRASEAARTRRDRTLAEHGCP